MINSNIVVALILLIIGIWLSIIGHPHQKQKENKPEIQNSFVTEWYIDKDKNYWMYMAIMHFNYSETRLYKIIPGKSIVNMMTMNGLVGIPDDIKDNFGLKHVNTHDPDKINPHKKE